MIEDVELVLDSLQRRELVQSHSPRYTLTGSLDEALQEEWDLTPWNERALEHFAEWAEQQRQAPEQVAEEADAILGTLKWAQQDALAVLCTALATTWRPERGEVERGRGEDR